MSTATAIREIRFGDSFQPIGNGKGSQPQFWVWGAKWPAEGGCTIILAAYADPAEKRHVAVEELLSSYRQTETNDCKAATVAWRADWACAGGGASMILFLAHGTESRRRAA